MKKMFMGILAGAAMMLTMASCGEKLLTDAEVQQEIAKGVEAGKPAIEAEVNAACESTFQARVDSKVAELQMAAEAAMPQEAPMKK